MLPSVISDVSGRGARDWLLALTIGALLTGCSASRPPVCQPSGDPSHSVAAVTGRLLIGVAEVLVGAKLADDGSDEHRGACSEVAGQDASNTGTALRARDLSLSALESQASKHPAGAAQGSHAALSSAQSATKSEAAQGRQGRWILVRKTARTLVVFDADRRLKTYPAVFGVDPLDPKLYEGDRRTPEGEYHIVAKHVHPEWQRFLLLDYPNADNREVYAWSRAKGLIPARGGNPVGTGGAIGIHGTKDDDLNRNGINWTYGCVSLSSRDIEELYDLIPVGTLVVIEH